MDMIANAAYWLALAALGGAVVVACIEGVDTYKPNSGWTWIAVALILVHLGSN